MQDPPTTVGCEGDGLFAQDSEKKMHSRLEGKGGPNCRYIAATVGSTIGWLDPLLAGLLQTGTSYQLPSPPPSYTGCGTSPVLYSRSSSISQTGVDADCSALTVKAFHRRRCWMVMELSRWRHTYLDDCLLRSPGILSVISINFISVQEPIGISIPVQRS